MRSLVLALALCFSIGSSVVPLEAAGLYKPVKPKSNVKKAKKSKAAKARKAPKPAKAKRTRPLAN